MSKERMSSFDSKACNFILFSRIKASISTHGAKTLSQYVSSRLLYKSYKIANKSYVYAIIFTNDANKISTLRQKNKRVCEFVDKNDRVYEKSERHDRRRKSDYKYDNKIQKIKDIGEKILIPSVVIFAIATIVFLILMIIGLIVSNGLFAFSWKALLASLGLTILAFVSLYYTTDKL